MNDKAGIEEFPSDAYRETVLRPAFLGAKSHLQYIRRIDRAHLVMLAEQAILPSADAATILAALPQIDAELDLDAMKDAGRFEDLFFLLEDRLIARLGPELGGSLHVARSRNDLEATTFKMALKTRLRAAMGQLCDLLAALLGVARREQSTVIVAYTHGQPAQPTTMGHYLGAIIESLLRQHERLSDAYRTVDLCPLGAAAITTTGFPIDRHRTASLLGFAAPQENSYGCIASVDYLTATYSALKLALLDIGRLCQDLAFWCGFEVNQLRASNGFVQVSSIMPQKRNPLAIEHARTMASIGAGQCETVIGTVHNTPLADMVDAESPTQQAGYGAFDSFARTTRLLAALVSGLTINRDSVERNIAASFITMTELADSLARLEGISFRTAHHVTSHLVRAMSASDLRMSDLNEALLGSSFESVVGRPPRLRGEELRRLIEAEHFVSVRQAFGGPGAAALEASLGRYEDQLDAYIAGNQVLAQAEAQSTEQLYNAVREICER